MPLECCWQGNIWLGNVQEHFNKQSHHVFQCALHCGMTVSIKARSIIWQIQEEYWNLSGGFPTRFWVRSKKSGHGSDLSFRSHAEKVLGGFYSPLIKMSTVQFPNGHYQTFARSTKKDCYIAGALFSTLPDDTSENVQEKSILSGLYFTST